MELKLTNEEKAKVFAMYLGAKYCDERKIMYPVSGRVITQVINGTFPKCYKISLTPLSSITDEHALEVYGLNTNYPEFHNDSEAKIYNAKEWLNAPEFPIAWDCYHYLISKGYDVPLWFGVGHWANGKTAIELGIAIDKTKL